jgi:hypothetical protein
MKASWAVLDHSKEIHVSRTPLALTADAESMIVPCVSPFSGIRIDGREEEVLDEPNVCITINNKAIIDLKVLEKTLPFCTKTLRDITPETFDIDVMHTPIFHMSGI